MLGVNWRLFHRQRVLSPRQSWQSLGRADRRLAPQFLKELSNFIIGPNPIHKVTDLVYAECGLIDRVLESGFPVNGKLIAPDCRFRPLNADIATVLLTDVRHSAAAAGFCPIAVSAPSSLALRLASPRIVEVQWNGGYPSDGCGSGTTPAQRSGRVHR